MNEDASNTEKTNNNIDSSEFLTLYQVSAQEIAFFKEQQWKITNYGLLLYAAVIGIARLFPDFPYALELGLLWALSFLVLIIGIFLVCKLDTALSEARERVSRARRLLSDEFFEASVGVKKDDPSSAKAQESPSLAPLFYGIFIIGFLISTWVLFRFFCNL